jgi:hypothetical protein
VLRQKQIRWADAATAENRTLKAHLRNPTYCTWAPLCTWQNAQLVILNTNMRELLRFFWNATRGHRLAPWRSPYLRWRMETYSGLKMDKIGFVEFWGFMVRERKQLRRFLKWTAEMDNYARPKPKNP